METRIISLLWLAGLAVTAAPAHGQESARAVPLYGNLGDHHYAVSTHDSLVQKYFDQGLRLYYAFNHAEAIRSFEEAARRDPGCAMCFWGVALSYGPNINLPMDSVSGRAAFQALQRAVEVAQRSSAGEQALIGALSRRYLAVPPAHRAALDSAYAAGMKDVVAHFPDDAEARTLYAEALMDLSPWNYWQRDGMPRAGTTELLEQLETVMLADPRHPGANHFYIHAVEAVQPERAVAAAERLAGLMPGAGHLVHMPGHIYVRVGRYAEAIRANQHAVHMDESWIQDQNPVFGVYVAGYYPHNYDFLAFAASMIGRSEQSLGAAERLATLAPPEMLREPGMAFVQHHRTRHLQLKVRFERWEDILAAAAPAADLPHARAMWHYARGRALAALGKTHAAETELAHLHAAATSPDLAALRLEFNYSGAVLGIADEVLAGHIAAARAEWPAAESHLREAARREDALTYGEPPDWTIPVRQELGRVLLAADQPRAAERVFREDLQRFPDNGWSLHGLALALEAQGRHGEAAEAAQRFRAVGAEADVPARPAESAD